MSMWIATSAAVHFSSPWPSCPTNHLSQSMMSFSLASSTYYLFNLKMSHLNVWNTCSIFKARVMEDSQCTFLVKSSRLACRPSSETLLWAPVSRNLMQIAADTTTAGMDLASASAWHTCSLWMHMFPPRAERSSLVLPSATSEFAQSTVRSSSSFPFEDAEPNFSSTPMRKWRPMKVRLFFYVYDAYELMCIYIVIFGCMQNLSRDF